MAQETGGNAERLKQMDDAEVGSVHWKIMFISGMGFFTDAYDLFIIGVVMAILKDQWHPTPLQIGLVTSTALLASAVGALIFGRVAASTATSVWYWRWEQWHRHFLRISCG